MEFCPKEHNLYSRIFWDKDTVKSDKDSRENTINSMDNE